MPLETTNVKKMRKKKEESKKKAGITQDGSKDN